jgi:hypothetical protein
VDARLEELVGLGEGQRAARLGDVRLQRGERDEDLACLPGGDGDLEILVLTGKTAEEEVDCPAGGDAPGRLDPGEPRSRLGRRPRLPRDELGGELARPASD